MLSRTIDVILKQASKGIKLLRINPTLTVGFFMVSLLLLIVIFTPYIAPYSPTKMHSLYRLEPAFSRTDAGIFLFGTDRSGRDIFSRIIWGTRNTLFVALGANIIATSIGVLLGTLSGYFGGYLETILMRFIDIALTFPSLLLAIIVVAILGPGMINALIAMGFVYSFRFTRIVRSAILEIKEEDYVLSADAIGASNIRIILSYILKNVTPTILVYSSLIFSFGVLAESGLSFLGLGVQPPNPSWGQMLRSGREVMEISANLSIFPGLAIMFAVLSFNLLGDALRDILDPKLRGQK